MITHAKERTYEGVARAAWALAQQEASALERIEHFLENGDSESALTAMKDFFGQKKPSARAQLYDTEERKRVV
jgi:hypothetical protein